ncbi:MAG: hypothetical protein J6B87_00055 [Clostridia bacterium]|nr:hypothetical protein [Clostridia bacterium]
MPKLKLRGWQFMLMHDAMMEKCEREMQKLYILLCELNGTPFENSHSMIDEKRISILKNYDNLRDFCQDQIRTYNESVEEGICESDNNFLAGLNTQLKTIEETIQKINDSYSRILEIRRLAQLIKEKSTNKDFWPGYDDDDSDPDDKPELDPDEWDRRTDALVY